MYKYKHQNTLYFLYDTSTGLRLDWITFHDDSRQIFSSIADFPTEDSSNKALRTFFLDFLPGIGANAIDLDQMAVQRDEIIRKGQIQQQLEKLAADAKESEDKKKIEALREMLTGLVTGGKQWIS
jgi:hypothetical protein